MLEVQARMLAAYVRGGVPAYTGFTVRCLCRVSATDFVRLKCRLHEIIKQDEDQVLFIPLCGKCVTGMEALGQPTEPAEGRDVVVVV